MEEKALMDISILRKLKRFVAVIQAQVAVTALGQPMQLVNPNAILGTGLVGQPESYIDSPCMDQYLDVDYYEGLPTIDGTPVWERLEGEPLEYYNWFKLYRNMQTSNSSRAVFKVYEQTGVDSKHIELVRRAYHWNFRVESYDAYRKAERDRQMEECRYEVESKHRTVAAQLFALSTTYLAEHTDLLTPKMAMQMLTTAVKLERLSVGLSAKESSNPAAAVNIQTTNQITSNGSDQTTTISDDSKENKERLAQLLNIMNNIGVLTQEGEVIDVDSKPVAD